VPGLTEGIMLSVSSLLILGAIFLIVMTHNHKRHAVLPVIRGGTRAGRRIHGRRLKKESGSEQTEMLYPQYETDEEISDEDVTNMVMREIEGDEK